MIKQPFLTLILTTSVLIGCSSQLNEERTSLKTTLENVMDSANIPALSFSIIENNNLVSDFSLGVKNIKSGELIDSNTIFEAASLTKPITAYCAMRLVAEGKLDLDTPLYKYLEYEAIEYDERYKLITSRMVMSHTSGFPNWRRFNDDGKLDIKFTPSERYSYSGEGIVYLQRVMEKILDKRLDTILNDFVFEPLYMSNSSMIFPDTKNFTVGHDIDEIPQTKIQPNLPNGAASLYTTANDYSKFIQELINPKYIDKSNLESMFKPQINMSDSDTTIFFGLGVALHVNDGDTLFWHWGSNLYSRGFFIMSKSTQKGFVYFANSAMGLSIVDRMIELVYNDTSIMSGWNQYPQYTHPYFVLRNAYRDHGLNSAYNTFKKGIEEKPELYNDDFYLDDLGKLALELGNKEDALKLFKLNQKEYPDSEKSKKKIIKLEKELSNKY